MKQFTSELAGDPSYYSFGYSVYGILEDGDDLAKLYAGGYLPFVGVEDAARMMYMARSGRIAAQEFRENTYHTRLRRKAAGFSVRDYRWSEYPAQEDAIRLLLEYFRFRHGARAMPETRLRQILQFDPEMRLVEYKHGDVVAGYSVEFPLDTARHQWYFAYTRLWEGKHLGAYMMLDFITRTKESGLPHAYLGVTYGPSMVYKTNFHPIEFWNGRGWVRDAARLKALLKSDALRVLVTTDEWREAQNPYHAAPFDFSSIFVELRFLYLILASTPRIAIAVLIWTTLMALVLATTLFP